MAWSTPTAAATGRSPCPTCPRPPWPSPRPPRPPCTSFPAAFPTGRQPLGWAGARARIRYRDPRGERGPARRGTGHRRSVSPRRPPAFRTAHPDDREDLGRRRRVACRPDRDRGRGGARALHRAAGGRGDRAGARVGPAPAGLGSVLAGRYRRVCRARFAGRPVPRRHRRPAQGGLLGPLRRRRAPRGRPPRGTGQCHPGRRGAARGRRRGAAVPGGVRRADRAPLPRRPNAVPPRRPPRRPGPAARPGAAVPAPPRRPRARAAQAGHAVMKPKQEQAREVRLREMRRGDMPGVMALEQELFPEDAWTPEMFASEFAQPASRRLYLVAEEGNTLIGYAGMMFTGGPQADVVTLAVDPD